MESRYFDLDDDYATVSKWFESWGWPPMPKQFLSTTGIIVSNGGVDICAAWLYKTDSAACWAEHYISNREAPKELRGGAVQFLIEKLIEEGKNKGFQLMMSSVKQKGLIKKLLDAGCHKEYDTGMCNLARSLV